MTDIKKGWWIYLIVAIVISLIVTILSLLQPTESDTAYYPVWGVGDNIIFCKWVMNTRAGDCIDRREYFRLTNLIDFNCDIPEAEIDTVKERNNVIAQIRNGTKCTGWLK